MSKVKKEEKKITKQTVDGDLVRKLAIVGIPPLYQGYLLDNWVVGDKLNAYLDKEVKGADSFLIIVGEEKLVDSYKAGSAVIEKAYRNNKSVSLVGLNSLFSFYKDAYRDRSAKAMLVSKLNHSEVMAFSNLSDDLLNLTDPEILRKFRDYLIQRFHRKQKTIICTHSKVSKKSLKRFFGEALLEGFDEAVIVRV